MSSLKNTYKSNINGIIFTLLFHILVFTVLNFSQFKIKREFQEPELIIDFIDPIIEMPKEEQQNETKQSEYNTKHITSVASNRALNNQNKPINNELQEEMDKARNLVRDVNKQLQKDIPTVENLKMPVETTEGMSPDSILKKLYTGDSNIEYFLDKRYHVRLPKPIYLSQYGGIVRINILVDRNGNVIAATPEKTDNIPMQLLSYAKTAALQTKFNRDNNAPSQQSGYIKYQFIAQ
jgi:hypothetical protein